jgi:hypothetical protein
VRVRGRGWGLSVRGSWSGEVDLGAREGGFIVDLVGLGSVRDLEEFRRKGFSFERRLGVVGVVVSRAVVVVSSVSNVLGGESGGEGEILGITGGGRVCPSVSDTGSSRTR